MATAKPSAFKLDAICNKLKSAPQPRHGETSADSSVEQQGAASEDRHSRKNRRKSLKPRSIFQREAAVTEEEDGGSQEMAAPSTECSTPDEVSLSSTDMQDTMMQSPRSLHIVEDRSLDSAALSVEEISGTCQESSYSLSEVADGPDQKKSEDKDKLVEYQGPVLGESDYYLPMDLSKPKTQSDASGDEAMDLSISKQKSNEHERASSSLTSSEHRSALPITTAVIPSFSSVIPFVESQAATSDTTLKLCDNEVKTGSIIGGTSTTATDASTMKLYAERTMKELLSIYGLNDMAETIANNVPLSNFSPGKILERHAPMPPTRKPNQKGTITVPTSQREGLYTTLRTKVVGNLTHITAAPGFSGGIDGPHVMVHRNMVAKVRKPHAISPKQGNSSPSGRRS